MAEQLPLFGFREMLPNKKVPINADRIRKAKAMMEAGDGKGAARNMRMVREALEDYEHRLNNR